MNVSNARHNEERERVFDGYYRYLSVFMSEQSSQSNKLFLFMYARSYE